MINYEVFKQLSHPIRLRLVALLLEHELCVCELEEITDIRQANLSKHLMKLKESGIATVRREKQRGFYSLTETFKNEQDLIKYIKKLMRTDETIQADWQRFLNHEDTKDQNIYVCNMFKKETLT